MSEATDIQTQTGEEPFRCTGLVRPLVAGDIVRHGPTCEEWVLACDEERGEVMPCGWPMCIAKAKDCSLVTAATEEARAAMLKTWAEKQDSESSRDWRTLTARRQWPNDTAQAPTRDGDSQKH